MRPNTTQSANVAPLGPQPQDQSEEPRHCSTSMGLETVWSDLTVGFPYLPLLGHKVPSNLSRCRDFDLYCRGYYYLSMEAKLNVLR